MLLSWLQQELQKNGKVVYETLAVRDDDLYLFSKTRRRGKAYMHREAVEALKRKGYVETERPLVLESSED